MSTRRNDTKHPLWNAKERELRFRGKALKQWHRSAPRSECLLAAFEAEGWPESIPNPLPPPVNGRRKTQLNSALRNLNRDLPLIHFCSEQYGTRVSWRLRS